MRYSLCSAYGWNWLASTYVHLPYCGFNCKNTALLFIVSHYQCSYTEFFFTILTLYYADFGANFHFNIPTAQTLSQTVIIISLTKDYILKQTTKGRKSLLFNINKDQSTICNVCQIYWKALKTCSLRLLHLRVFFFGS